MSLEDRIREILAQSYDIDGPSAAIRLNHNNAIAQIIQAFKDEGWRKSNYSNPVGVYSIDDPSLMTGQEWLDRFEDEYDIQYKNVEFFSSPTEFVMEAARKAAGL